MASSANILALVASLSPALSQSPPESRVPNPQPLSVPDAAGPITLDGRLDEPAWAHAAWITSFIETWPEDNVPPPVRTAVAITYDAHFLYLGVVAQDPDPSQVHAAYADRDNVASPDDYIGFVLDTRGDGRSAALLRLSPRGIQADGVFNEAQFALGNPDDLTPDFTWDARVAMSDSGWTAELRIPFTSLRYPHRERQTWGLIVHRVYPRAFEHSIFSVPIPRGSNCFLCHEQRIELADLPTGGGLLTVPYATARAARTAPPARWSDGPSELRGGIDVKWTPGASTALDLTLRPDFSQIESDVTQLAVNTQFALFYPEKRPFFLEGSDLFQTPLQAVYTRAITAPDWGARATGEVGRTAYTLLVARDRGGGSVIIPGAVGSSPASQDFASSVAVGRTRTAFPGGFVGLLATDREIGGGSGGHNRLLGPDLFWNVTSADQLGAQLLASDTRVPRRPDVTAAWDGRGFTSGALDLTWHHLERHVEWFGDYREVGDGFRADDGFIPQVGVRLTNAWANLMAFPRGAINWVSPWVRWQRVVERAGGATVSESRYAGIQLGGIRNLNFTVRYSDERLRAGAALLPRRYAWMMFDLAPGRRLARVQVVARLGGDVDVANARTGRGGEVWDSVVVHLSDHLELQGQSDLTWLDIPGSGRLFTAGVGRLRAEYNLTPRAAVRLIVQNVRIRRDPALYQSPVPGVEGRLTLSGLISYRWNWATAAYLGWGDDRELDAAGDRFAPGRQQLFVKLQVSR